MLFTVAFHSQLSANLNIPQTTVHMRAILIIGATGKQGGSLIRSLVSRNAPFEILAVTRNPTSAPAQKLESLSSSIRLVEGDLDQPAAIFQKAQSLSSSSIWGVYSVQVIEFPTAILALPPGILTQIPDSHWKQCRRNTRQSHCR